MVFLWSGEPVVLFPLLIDLDPDHALVHVVHCEFDPTLYVLIESRQTLGPTFWSVHTDITSGGSVRHCTLGLCGPTLCTLYTLFGRTLYNYTPVSV